MPIFSSKVRVRLVQCSGRVQKARRTAAYYVGTGPTSLPVSVTVQLFVETGSVPVFDFVRQLT